MTDVSVVVISFNTREILKECLQSLRENAGGLSVEVIVIDNASADGSADLVQKEFPEVRLIRNAENRYFTGANNQGLSEAKGKHLLILNSDTRVLENSLSAMSGYLDRHPEAGGVTCRMQYPDGRFYVNGMGDYSFLLALVNCTVLGVLLPGLKKKLNAELGYQGEDWTRDREVAVVGDCNLMIRRDVFEKVGLYDETMKLYYTENDYCVRIREKGFKIVYLADGKVVHHLRGTVSKSGLRKISKIYEEDTLAYFRKYSGTGAALLLKVLIGITNLLLTLRHGSPQNIFAKFLTPGKGDAKS